MSTPQIAAVLQAAAAEGLVPATAAAAMPQESRPWPVVLLTALGAWLAAIPLLVVVGLLLGDVLVRGAGPYIVGALVLGAAIVVLRSREVPAFIEQLAVPTLLVGGGSLGFGLFRDLPTQAAAAAMAMIVVGVTLAIARPWLRVLLGATAAVLMAVSFVPERWFSSNPDHASTFWWAWHLALAVWLLASAVQRTLLARGELARLAAAVESLAAGWLLAVLAGLAWWSGMTFLAGASLGGGLGAELAREATRRSSSVWDMPMLQAASLVLAVASLLWAARQWPTLRRPSNALAAAVFAALAWFMPALGGALLALAWCATTARWRLAAAAGLAAAWIVGAFYYSLDWPLAIKATVMVAAGAVLGGLAWWAVRSDSIARATAPSPATATPTPHNRLGPRLGIALTALAVLVVANVGIWQKENLIARGQPVFVELAPADPRSLMQGDFMRLNFNVPGGLQSTIDGLLTKQRPQVVARRDARGVLTLLRVDQGAPIAADEMRIELTPKNGRWMFVTDAWFFKEGEADRWAAAKYGEFRVDASGRALLVGLRGAQLQAL